MKNRGLFRFFFRMDLLSLVIWTSVIAAYNVVNILLFNRFGGETGIAEVYTQLPDIWKKTFGRFFISVNSIEGWLVTQFFAFLPLIIGFYTALSSGATISREIENHTIDSILSQPFSRTRVILLRIGNAYLGVLLLLIANAAVTIVTLKMAGYGQANFHHIILSYVSVTGISTFWLGIAFLAGTSAGNQKLAVSLVAGIVICSFLINALLVSLEISPLYGRWNPWFYFDCTHILNFNVPVKGGLIYWLVGAGAASVIGVIIFTKRDFKG